MLNLIRSLADPFGVRFLMETPPGAPPPSPPGGDPPPTPPAPDPPPAPGGPPAPPQGDPPADYTPPTAEEWANHQRKLREAEADRKKLADEKAKREREEAEAKGEHEKLAQQERERAEKAEAELQEERRRNRGLRIAQTVGFHDPADAVRLLPDSEVLDSDSTAEKALKDLAKAKSWMLRDAGKAPTGSHNGDRAGDGEDLSSRGRMARSYKS